MRFCKFVRVLLKLQSLGFRSPFGRASYLSLLMQTKVTQRKPHPAARSPGSGNCSCVALPPASMPSPALRVREGATGFAECTSVCMQRTGAHRARQPAAFPTPPSPHRRGPVSARRARQSKERPDVLCSALLALLALLAFDLGPPPPRRASQLVPEKPHPE